MHKPATCSCGEKLAVRDGPGRPKIRCLDCAINMRNAWRRMNHARTKLRVRTLGIENRMSNHLVSFAEAASEATP